MEKKKLIMLIVALLFLIGVAVITYDMARQTHSPWSKEKFNEKYKVK